MLQEQTTCILFVAIATPYNILGHGVELLHGCQETAVIREGEAQVEGWLGGDIRLEKACSASGLSESNTDWNK